MSWDWDDETEVTQGSGDFKEVETGVHTANLETAEVKETQSGSPYLNLWWRIQGGTNNNQIAFQKVWATEKAQAMYKMNMSKLGIKDHLKDLNTTGEILTRSANILNDKNIHAEIYVSYSDSEYNGQSYRNQNVSINQVFNGEARQDGVLNHAMGIGNIGIKDDESLPF